MPAPYTVATATARVRGSWGAFTIFASRMLGATAMDLPDERQLGQLVSALRIDEPADSGASELLHAHVVLYLPHVLRQLNPKTRLNSFLRSHLDSALTSLGLSVAAANAALGAALESIAHGNMLISRLY